VRLVIIFLIIPVFFAELVPAIQSLPLNTILAVVIYLLMHPRVTGAYVRAEQIKEKAESRAKQIKKQAESISEIMLQKT
jgi:ACR3 family arsenite efflux pump ArsB